MAQFTLSKDEIAVLYYYHGDSGIKYTREMEVAYSQLVIRIRDAYKTMNTPPAPNKVWEALKGVVG